MKFGCASGGSPWRSSLLSLYRVPRSGKLLSSLVPIADISNKKRKLVQTDGAEDENVKVCKPKKEGEPEDYIDDIADEDESDSDEEDEEEYENVYALKPILNKFKEAVEKFDTMLQKCSLKCKHCEFEAKDQNGLGMHMKAKHTNLNNS